MASNGPWQPGGFEDQLRRMILNDGQPAAAGQISPQAGSPTVRLPPTGAYSPQQSSYGNPTTRQRNAFPPPTWHGRNASSPQNQFGPGLGPMPQPMQPGQGMHHRGNYAPHHRTQQQQSGFHPMPQMPNDNSSPQQRARYQQPMALDPNAFHRGGFGRPFQGRGSGSQQLFNPNQPRRPPAVSYAEKYMRQSQYLDQVATVEIRNVGMSRQEQDEKESFRIALEKICHELCADDPERFPVVSLEPFGSFRSGFATAGSDMDLVIVVKDKTSTSACFSLLEDDLPRALERRLLHLGYGARLLTRTRVPIIKVCQEPGESFLDRLREERLKWDDLPNEQKYPHLHANDEDAEGDIPEDDPNAPIITVMDKSHTDMELSSGQDSPADSAVATDIQHSSQSTNTDLKPAVLGTSGGDQVEASTNIPQQVQNHDTKREEKPWSRERKAGPLDFPKTGVGIQSDINFFNPLGLHNTQLLRCYSLCDVRVQPMVLFVKAWAKKRKINSSYSGTLSSYGYVLMVLHYLVNVAQPPVLPNLQTSAPSTGDEEVVDGWSVRFRRDEAEIAAAVQNGQMTPNRDTLGALLTGFFQYYASQGAGVIFRWTHEVLSLRSEGGILTKVEKNWVKAVTQESEGKKIQHRYLFCIEDPFELDHNVARTVTHNGIVAIRDEFRRANRILMAVGNGNVSNEGELFADLIEVEDIRNATMQLKMANGVQNGALDGLKDSKVGNTASHQNTTNNMTNQRAHEMNQYHQNAGPHPPKRGGIRGGLTPSARSKSLDVNDNEAFPTLGGSKPSKKKVPRSREGGEEFSEISGARAQAHLEEVKRLKDEAQAESTATGAAEAVLNGID